MLLTESCIRTRARELHLAQADTIEAYARLRRSIRATATSPVGVSAGFLVGLGMSRFLCCRPAGAQGSRRRLHRLSILLPLLRLI